MKKFSFFLIITVSTLLLAFSLKPQTNTLVDKAELKGFDKPDEVREFPLGKVELVKIGGGMIGRATFQPGWRWLRSWESLFRRHGIDRRCIG